MKANCWYGKHDVRVEEVSDPKILNRRDAIVKITSTAICGSDLHLYNGLHSDDGEGRYSRPRVHGRSDRSRQRSQEPEHRRPGSGLLPDLLRQLLFLSKANVLPLRELQPECALSLKNYSAIPPPAFMVTRICLAALPAGRQNTPGCHLPMSGRSRFRKACRMKKFYFFPTFSRPDTWRRKTATFSQAILLRCGVAVLLVNLPSASANLLGAERVIAHRPVSGTAPNG